MPDSKFNNFYLVDTQNGQKPRNVSHFLSATLDVDCFFFFEKQIDISRSNNIQSADGGEL